jgi:DNA-binding NarL/FixJ family response regulator
MFSSSDEPSDLKECMRLGADAYHVKPFDIDEFSECVTEILAKWLPSQVAEEAEC